MSRGLPVTLAAVALALAALIAFTGDRASDATFPGANGRIAFTTTRDGAPEVYSMNPDGGDPANLSNNNALDSFPEWSADGQKIVFSSTRDGQAEIYIMDADGSNPQRVTNNPVADTVPAWSPDGQKIAFHRIGLTDQNVFVINADGSGETKLTDEPNVVSSYPDWSPDGSKIAYVRRPAGGVPTEIWVVDSDGSNPVPVASVAAAGAGVTIHGRPSWSPDGSKILFDSNESGNYEVYVMDADGGAVTNLTNNPGADDQFAAWSPDGNFIVYQSEGADGFDIYVMNADGSNPQQITDAPLSSHLADWGTYGAATGTATEAPPTPACPGATAPPGGTCPPCPGLERAGVESTCPPTAPAGDQVTWADNNCSGTADPVDSLLTLRHDAALSANTGECPAMGAEVDVLDASPHLWGDVDCTGAINPVDSLKILRFDAALSVSQEDGCPEMGAQVTIAGP